MDLPRFRFIIFSVKGNLGAPTLGHVPLVGFPASTYGFWSPETSA